jgi:signal transduction histidine kinase/DNA-binding response OmpR family regulator
MTDAQGLPLGLVSISRDVTGQVELETNLQQAHNKLEQRVEERTAELVQSNHLLLQEIAGRARIETELEEHRATLARKVEEQTADLRLANMELARSARLKDEFLANMSHELRTPLNAVLGLSEALQEEVYGPLTPQQRLSLQSIYESGQHLLTMINDVLDLAKVGAGTIDLDIDITDVEAVCQASLRMVQHSAHKKRLSVSEHIDAQVALLLADQRRLKQILVNLLSNAVKFTPEGGRIGLMVTGDQAGQMVHFEVWDTGIGVTPEHQERLFQPFSQIDSSLARQYEGTGLGLALVARLAEMHGGSVQLESTEGQGSRFIVSLPWHVPALDVAATTEPEYLAEAADTSDRPVPAIQLPAGITKALVIEDSTAAAEQVARYLRELHIEVTLLEQGMDAVRRAIRLKPDVILLDLLLPDVQGWEVLAALRANPDTCAIPVIITSVMDDEARGFGLGASAYLVKPISREQLHAAILRIFAVEGSSDQPAQALEAMPLVLVVEDNEANVVMLSEYLPSRGYRVMAVTSGEEAIEYASTHQPDIILMDIQMPGMDGLEATRHIRALPAQATTPIVAVTALAMPGDRERCLAAGADDYLSKPINLQALLRTIERLLPRSA